MKHILTIENWINTPDNPDLFTNDLQVGDWVMVKPNPSLYDIMNKYTDNNAGQIVGFDKGGNLLAIFVQFLNTPNDNRILNHLYTNKDYEKSRIYYLDQITGSGKTPEEAKESRDSGAYKEKLKFFNTINKYNL